MKLSQLFILHSLSKIWSLNMQIMKHFILFSYMSREFSDIVFSHSKMFLSENKMCFKSALSLPAASENKKKQIKQPLEIFIVNSTHFYTQKWWTCFTYISSLNLPSWVSWYFTFKCKYNCNNSMCTDLYKCPEEIKMSPPGAHEAIE